MPPLLRRLPGYGLPVGGDGDQRGRHSPRPPEATELPGEVRAAKGEDPGHDPQLCLLGSSGTLFNLVVRFTLMT